MRCTPGYGSELSAQPIFVVECQALVRQAKDTRSKDEQPVGANELCFRRRPRKAPIGLPKVTDAALVEGFSRRPVADRRSGADLLTWNATVRSGSTAVPAHGLRKTLSYHASKVVRSRNGEEIREARRTKHRSASKRSAIAIMMLPVAAPSRTSVLISSRVLWIVVEFDLITRLHDGHADVAAAPLPGIGLSIDDVVDRSTRVRKGVLCAAELGQRLAKVLRLRHGDDCLGPVGLLDGVGRVSVNAGGDDDDADKAQRECMPYPKQRDIRHRSIRVTYVAMFKVATSDNNL